MSVSYNETNSHHYSDFEMIHSFIILISCYKFNKNLSQRKKSIFISDLSVFIADQVAQDVLTYCN